MYTATNWTGLIETDQCILLGGLNSTFSRYQDWSCRQDVAFGNSVSLFTCCHCELSSWTKFNKITQGINLTVLLKMKLFVLLTFQASLGLCACFLVSITLRKHRKNGFWNVVFTGSWFVNDRIEAIERLGDNSIACKLRFQQIITEPDVMF